MTEFALEIAKIKRRRVLPIVLALASSGVLWTMMALMKAANSGKLTMDAATVLSEYLMVLPLVVPLLVAVLVVRVAGAEQEKDMLTRLVAAGASRTRLWGNKLLLIAGFLAVAQLVGFVAVVGFGTSLGASINVGLTAQMLLLVFVTSVELAALLLVIALRGNRQPVIIAIGLALAIAGALMALAPTGLQLLLPSTQIYAANPTQPVLDASNYIVGYAPDPAGAALIPLVVLLSAAVVAVSALIHRIWKAEA